MVYVAIISIWTYSTGFMSHLRAKLRDWAVRPVVAAEVGL